MLIKFIVYILFMMVNSCSSSLLLEKLRRHKDITYLPELSSPNEINIHQNSQFRLSCAFLSNFDKLNVFWYHNGTLIQSFISKSILEEEDNDIESSYLASTIVSTIEIDQTNIDMNGLYQCVATHDQVTSQHSFNVHVNTKINSNRKTIPEDVFITVHTYQTLFEPRSETSLMCRFNNNPKDECIVQWFNPEDEPLNTLGEKNDLLLKNANFEDHMGLFKCQICCHERCRTLTSFVYPAAAEK
ncbi:unnamed protein product [Adineta steineri]|uniref:Ig-like domain-containing protein n=2 Tax=Adineta steineri TaxID=433720 RepID=A0A819EKD2_9BILA|nr:unnamed protein product [Adineta steineri]